MPVVKFPPFDKLVNPKFAPIFENKDRYLHLWGSRNSSKSVSTARKLIYRCLSEKYFRYILVRKVYDTIKESSWQTIKDEVEAMGLESLFTFKVSPLEIICKNGNRFICRGLDKAEKLKSLKDPTGAWYEEATQMTFDDFTTVTTSIRTIKAFYLQEIFTFNPETDINYEDFWLYKMFFEGHAEKNFRAKRTIELNIGGKKVSYDSWYTSHHSTYKDNKYVSDQQRADLEQWKEINPYYYNTYTLGEWGNRDVGNRFWKSFDRLVHVKGGVELNHDETMHLVFDENVNPYQAVGVWQFTERQEGERTIKQAIQVYEIALRSPNNKLEKNARAFMKWLTIHEYNNTVFIYGDASSDKEDAKLQKGVNYFTMLRDIIAEEYPARIKKSSKNPPVALSAEFINAVYEANFGDVEVIISDQCKESINDYILVQEGTTGNMLKPKKDGIEIMGHFSDTKRYILCEVFKKEFAKYISRARKDKPRHVIGTKSQRKY